MSADERDNQDSPDNWERRETLEELRDVARLAEEMAQRLVIETHGESYIDATELRALLHQVRAKVELLAKGR